jgi:hypothetical protein
MDDQNNIIDEFHYTEKMHHRMLHYVKGVSLERISPHEPATLATNWQSAAEDAGFATPGYQNTQYMEASSLKATVELIPQAFSPNGDGYNDELNINYHTPDHGWVANIWIFDTAGRTVMQLAKNRLLATKGSITWNGADETGRKIANGPYVMFIEMYDLYGHLHRFKNAFYITDRWE